MGRARLRDGPRSQRRCSASGARISESAAGWNAGWCGSPPESSLRMECLWAEHAIQADAQFRSRAAVFYALGALGLAADSEIRAPADRSHLKPQPPQTDFPPA